MDSYRKKNLSRWVDLVVEDQVVLAAEDLVVEDLVVLGILVAQALKVNVHDDHLQSDSNGINCPNPKSLTF